MIRRTRELTDRPFGVDLILPARLEQTGVRASDVAERIPPAALGRRATHRRRPRRRTAGVTRWRPANALGTDAEAQIAVVLEEQVPVFVGALGTPGAVRVEVARRRRSS